MRTAVLMLTALAVFGQVPAEQLQDRTFYSTQAKTVQELQEVATLIRSIADIQRISVDTTQRTITLKGIADQVILAEWLFSELDKVVQPHSATPEFRVGGSSTDVVRVFYFGNAATV